MIARQKQLLETEDEPRPMRIRGWKDQFEKSDAKKLVVLTWISSPVSVNSSGYQHLLDHFEDVDVAAIYGCWQLLCQVAATAPERGVLAGSNGEPYTVKRIARLACMPGATSTFKKMIDWALDFGWLEYVPENEPEACPGDSPEGLRDSSVDHPTLPGESSENLLTTQHNMEQQDKTQPNPTSEGVVNWERVESELCQCGVGAAGKAIKKARRNGLSVDGALAIIDQFRDQPGDVSPGILFNRITNPAINLPPTEGWPKRPAKQSIQARDAALSAASEKKRAEHDQHKSKVQAERLELQTLEKKLGDQIDSLSLEELLLLVPSGPPRSTLKVHGWRAPAVKGTVLRKVQAQLCPD